MHIVLHCEAVTRHALDTEPTCTFEPRPTSKEGRVLPVPPTASPALATAGKKTGRPTPHASTGPPSPATPAATLRRAPAFGDSTASVFLPKAQLHAAAFAQSSTARPVRPQLSSSSMLCHPRCFLCCMNVSAGNYPNPSSAAKCRPRVVPAWWWLRVYRQGQRCRPRTQGGGRATP